MNYTPSDELLTKLAVAHQTEQGYDYSVELDEIRELFALPQMEVIFRDWQKLEKRKKARPAQPTRVEAGQIWESRASGGRIKVRDADWVVNWDRVSGRGHKSGNCYKETLRDKYDYVEG